jgi:hypothetical protein
MGGLGRTGGRWRQLRIGSVMVVLASFQHVIGMARQNSAKPDFSILSAPHVEEFNRILPLISYFLFYSIFNFYSMYRNKVLKTKLNN